MSNFYRLLLTGSRNADGTTLWVPTPDGSDDDPMAGAEPCTLAQILTAVTLSVTRSGYSGLELVHGHCPKGVDAVGDRWAHTRIGRGWPVTVERHPADWNSGGRGAGFKRNTTMAHLGANSCYAFVAPCADARCRRTEPHGSHGAAHCVDEAKRFGIHVQRFEPADLLARADAGSLPNPERR